MNLKNESFICYNCGGKMNNKKTEQEFSINEYTLTLKGLNAHICESCDEKLFSFEETKMIQSLIQAFNQTASPKPDILNLDETATLLRVSNQTIYNMIKDGRLKAYKVGREWRIQKKDIESFFPERSLDESITIAAKGGEVDSSDAEVIREKMLRRLSDG